MSDVTENTLKSINWSGKTYEGVTLIIFSVHGNSFNGFGNICPN
jgi:hypothetical protein